MSPHPSPYRSFFARERGSRRNADLVYTIDGLLSTLTYPNGIRVEYGYDGGNRLTTVVHRVVLTGVVLISYTAVYDNGNRITSITELPSGDVTSFGYDNANNLLSETRTGTKPYSGTYTYDKTNRRKTALVVTNGTTTHNGTYTYDGAGRLTQVVDSATGLTEVYTWNNDGTLASAPGSGYTKVFGYDEEGHLTSIGHNVAGTVTTLYQYGYGADGNRRWRKDLSGNVWTWYPCGVACSAGDLVEQTSNLTGTTWATSGLYLRAGGGCSSQLIRRNSEYHHEDFLGDYGVITSGTGTILSNNLYDAFQVQRFSSGTAVSSSRFMAAKTDVEGLLFANTDYTIAQRDLALTVTSQASSRTKTQNAGYDQCRQGCRDVLAGDNHVCDLKLRLCMHNARGNRRRQSLCARQYHNCRATAENAAYSCIADCEDTWLPSLPEPPTVRPDPTPDPRVG